MILILIYDILLMDLYWCLYLLTRYVLLSWFCYFNVRNPHSSATLATEKHKLSCIISSLLTNLKPNRKVTSIVETANLINIEPQMDNSSFGLTIPLYHHSAIVDEIDMPLHTTINNDTQDIAHRLIRPLFVAFYFTFVSESVRLIIFMFLFLFLLSFCFCPLQFYMIHYSMSQTFYEHLKKIQITM